MSDKMREALQDLVIRYRTLFQIYAAKAYRPGCDWASDLDLGLAQAREALAQSDQPTAPAVPAWRQFPEQVPDPDTECLVEVAFNGALYRAVDTWEMQRYMPVEWSSATVEIGYGWSAHDDVQRWIPISSIAAAPAPVAPDDVVKDAARYRWLRDQDYDDGCVIAMKEKHIPRFVNYSQAIDDYIDAAMLAAAPTVEAKGGES